MAAKYAMREGWLKGGQWHHDFYYLKTEDSIMFMS
jgi:hypothetical protein